MKRIIAYILTLMSLLVVVAFISAYSGQQISESKVICSTQHDASQSFYSVPDFSLNLIGNENVKTEIGSQSSFSRQHFQLFQFRIIRTEKLVQQKFLSSSFWYISLKQMYQYKGYYLFHLCKMLI